MIFITAGIAWVLTLAYAFGLMFYGPVSNVVALGFSALLYSTILNRMSLSESGSVSGGSKIYVFRVVSYGNYLNSRICQTIVFGITIYYVLANHVQALFGG